MESSSKFADFDEFDLLDPCCQKEILNERKKKEIGYQLRQTDRSNVRLDLKKQIFKKNNTYGCSCCDVSADYSALSKLRQLQYCKEATIGNSICLESGNRNTDLGHDEDDGDSIDEFDDYVSDFELQKRREFELQVQKLRMYETLGFGKHTNESITHLNMLIQSLPFLIVHMHNNTEVDARLDLELEKLSKKFYGTLFRRVSLSDSAISLFFNTHLVNHNNYGNGSMDIETNQPSLLCFVNHKLTSATSNMTQFGGRGSDDCDDVVYESDLIRYFDMSHVLHLQPSEADLLHHHAYIQQLDQGIEKEEEGEEENSYCDDPSCSRRFPHEHVGQGQGRGSLLKQEMMNNSSNNSSDGIARDILPENYFTRL